MVFFNAVGAFMAHDTFCSGGVVDQVLAFLFNLAVVPSGAHFSRLATNATPPIIAFPWPDRDPTVSLCLGSKHLGRVRVMTKAFEALPGIKFSVQLLLYPLGIYASN